MFPQEYTPPPERTADEKHAMQEYAQDKFQDMVGDIVSSIGLIGQSNAARGADAVFSALQSTHANKHMMFMILEKITPRNVSANLVVLNAQPS